MNRTVHEVTFMAAKLKEPTQRPTESIADAIIQEAKKKEKKVIPTEKPQSESVWTQEQQKLLEIAIVKYPKTTVGDRWQKIANTVPGKAKEECLLRYKYLVQKVKEQKQKGATIQNESEELKSEETTESVNRVENIENQNDEEEEANNGKVEAELEPETVAEKKTGGKPRNKRKERKKRMEFSSDEDNYDYE